MWAWFIARPGPKPFQALAPWDKKNNVAKRLFAEMRDLVLQDLSFSLRIYDVYNFQDWSDLNLYI